MTPAEWHKAALARIDYLMSLGIWKREDRDEMYSLGEAVQAYETHMWNRGRNANDDS